MYDAAAAYHHQVLPREHLLKSLTPLYLGRIAAFVLATQGLTSAEAEHVIEHLCQSFEKHKPYLLERWDEMERQPALSRLSSGTGAGGPHERID